MKKNIYIVIIILVFGSFINVHATENVIYIEGKYQQEQSRNMLELINNWRKDTTNNWYYNSNNEKVYPGELPALTYDYGLESIAMQRAAEIAVYFEHKRPNGLSISTLQANGYRSVGENIAAGYSSPEKVFVGWQETNEQYEGQGHRRNMLSSRYTSIGIACINIPQSTYGLYCVQEFGAHSNISTEPTEISNTTQKLALKINTDKCIINEEVSLDNNETTIIVGDEIDLPLGNAKLYSESTYVNSKAILEWSIISGSEYITLNNYKVTAKKAGTAVLKGDIGKSSVTYTINVTTPTVEVTGISLNKTKLSLEKGKTEKLTATITPSNATNKTVTWTSNNKSVATVDSNGTITAVGAGTATITAKTNNGKTVTCTVTVPNPQPVVTKKTKVTYTTHVQNIGWQNYVSDGAMAGTSGKSLRLEGIKIKLENQEYNGNILYRTHIENLGWEKSFKQNDVMSGTEGRSYRLEAIEIKLDGEISNHYDIYYRVHAEQFGWMGWAKNGEEAGTAGYAYRLEGIEIQIVEKGASPKNYDPSKVAFKDKDAGKKISYTTHVQNIGWQDYVSDGAMAGTEGKSLRLEGIKIKLMNNIYNGSVEYTTHVQNIGWQDYVKDDKMAGTSGRSLRLEGIRIRLTNDVKAYYDVYYRVHAEQFGWMGWARNGEDAGTAGYAYRLEGIEIKLVEKGQSFPEYGKAKAFQEKK